MKILETINLNKKYADFQAVKDLNLNVESEKLTAFLGTNGAGKSTTIKMLIGLLMPTSGEICYQSNTQIGVVFQNSLLDARLTIYENLAIRARMYRNVSNERVDELIDLVEAESFRNQMYGTLSGGQKRRIDIARAMLNKPQILFLDEPTTGLDLQTRTHIWQFLNHLQKEEGLTIFLTTHYLEEAGDADQIYVIDHGEIIAAGSADELKDQYATNCLGLKLGDPETFIKEHRDLEFEQTDRMLRIKNMDIPSTLDLLKSPGIIDFEYQKGTLDDVFLNLTGKEIR